MYAGLIGFNAGWCTHYAHAAEGMSRGEWDKLPHNEPWPEYLILFPKTDS